MPERVVVSFCGAPLEDPTQSATYFDRALSIKKRAEARGAALCAWGALSFSFSFSPDDLEEALGLAALLLEKGPETDSFKAGVAGGDMRPVSERGSLEALEWGAPLVAATSAAELARPGEVVIDESFLARRGPDFGALGFEAAREVRERGAATARDAQPLARAAVAVLLRREPSQPPSVPARGGRVAGLVKSALLQGETAPLELLIAELRETGAHGDLIERMSGFVALRRGATLDGLRQLRGAAEAVTEPAQKARARLAYGVALASAGRTEGALLEALGALAFARKARDTHGEHACSLFLARLSLAAGHVDAASAWRTVAERAASV